MTSGHDKLTLSRLEGLDPLAQVARGMEIGSKQRHTTAIDYENKWRESWRNAGLFESKPKEGVKKYFICVPYSYQNGPLHLGHGFTFTRGDAIARYKRMRGYNVLFPWAWHWTGEAVAGTSERLKRGDETVVRMLREMDGVPEELLPMFEHPPFICAYYTAENRAIVDMMGWSVDWSREFYTTNLHPYYSKFITWQYETLRRRGLVGIGRHPVVWCPVCLSATGDHDRLSGEGIYPEEYTVVYFNYNGYKLAAATLRPETLYGATNLWLNPDAKYVAVEFKGLKIIVSREAVEKLRYQWDDLKICDEISPQQLIGKNCNAPITGAEIPILPASFVDPSIGTGVVYSVPAHAPFDYAALRDLWRESGRLEVYGISSDSIRAIKPISVIAVEGFGEYPAVELVEKTGIVDQNDERLEEMTRRLYSDEYHRGVMVAHLDDVGGLPVQQARERVKDRLLKTGNGTTLYSLAGRVVCRSGDECVVKIVEDQWFLKFSDPGWKEDARQLVNRMDIYPPAARQWFLNVVDWLRNWACTRKSGLGTTLPWDRSWIVETLSDSTIYPALYTISRYLNADSELAEKMAPAIFDNIFLGLGDTDKLSREFKISRDVLENMRREFLYWYPVDLRVSAKDLVPNHLTFYLFHHTGIFPPQLWPRGVSVNGLISIEGAKMSKSRGNFISLKQAIAKYGADATRLTLLLSAEDLDDPDWREVNVLEAKNFLSNFLELLNRVMPAGESGIADGWLISMLNLTVRKVTDALEAMKTRTAANEVVYGMLNIWRWWVRRGGGRNGREFLEYWIRLLSPFAPFTAEEAWMRLGKKGFVSVERWPEYEPSKVDLRSVMAEEVLRDVLDDVREILKLVRGDLKEILIYSSAGWKVDLARDVIGLDIKEAMKTAGRAYGSKGGTIVPKVLDILRRYLEKAKRYTELAGFGDPEDILRNLLTEDRRICEEVAMLLKTELKIPVTVIAEEEGISLDIGGKARSALPLKPAIYVVAGR